MCIRCCIIDWTLLYFTGHGLHRGEGLWDHERTGCQLCFGYIWRTDRVFLRRYVSSLSNHVYQYKVDCKSSSLFMTDINKFLWMVRIGGSTDTGKHIKEHDYYTPTGEFRVDREGSPVLLNCLMYKMCYYRFGQVYTEGSKSTVFCLLVTLVLN